MSILSIEFVMRQKINYSFSRLALRIIGMIMIRITAVTTAIRIKVVFIFFHLISFLRLVLFFLNTFESSLSCSLCWTRASPLSVFFNIMDILPDMADLTSSTCLIKLDALSTLVGSSYFWQVVLKKRLGLF